MPPANQVNSPAAQTTRRATRIPTTSGSRTTWANVALPGEFGGFDRVAVSIARSNPSVAYVWGARGSTVYFYRRGKGRFRRAPEDADLTSL